MPNNLKKQGGETGDEIATSFVNARKAAKGLPAFPGEKPTTLHQAYAIQNAAVGLWGAPVLGWKVGRINGADIERYGVDRLAGPIFAPLIDGLHGPVETPMFADGFGAVEGEVIFFIGEDAPVGKTSWSTDEAKAIVGDARYGIEIASSPFAGINDHGPLVTIADFGNNNGLVVGAEIDNWRAFEIDDWACKAFVDGVSVGTGRASGIPGGPVESLRALLENTAARGMPLKKGMAVTTGAITGVHAIKVGQKSVVRFGEHELACTMTAQGEQP